MLPVVAQGTSRLTASVVVAETACALGHNVALVRRAPRSLVGVREPPDVLERRGLPKQRQ